MGLSAIILDLLSLLRIDHGALLLYDLLSRYGWSSRLAPWSKTGIWIQEYKHYFPYSVHLLSLILITAPS